MNRAQKIRGFDANELETAETLFSPEIDQDPWIQYHATSSIAEDRIDAEGLKWTPAICSASDAQALAAVYRSMNWCGRHGGGLVVLDGYSLTGDFQGQASKPIYFREYSLRSLLYADRDFAGGETVRAIRCAIRDLEYFLTSDDQGAEHLERQRRAAIELVASGALPDRVIRVELAWLSAQLKRFVELRERCEEALGTHRHGVVYAVRFTEEDLPWLNFNNSMGLRCYRHLPPDRLVAKVHILTDEGSAHCGKSDELFSINRWRYDVPDGLLATLKMAEASGRAYPVASAREAFSHRRDVELDRGAGVDESEDIARAHGGEDFVAAMRRYRGQLR